MNPHVQAILLGEKQNSESAQKLKYKVLKHYGLLTKELEVVNEYRGEYDLYMKSEQNPNEYILYRYKAIEVTDEEYVALLTKYKREHNIAKIGNFQIRFLKVCNILLSIATIISIIISVSCFNGEGVLPAIVIGTILLTYVPMFIYISTIISTAEAVNKLIDY